MGACAGSAEVAARTIRATAESRYVLMGGVHVARRARGTMTVESAWGVVKGNQRIGWMCLVLAGLLATPLAAPGQPVRFMLHGNMSHDLPTEEYLRFVEEVQPDILVMGVFDQRLYALASPGAK